MSTYTDEIQARDLGITRFDYGTHTVKTGVTTMKPGMLVTTFGETGADIDILATDDKYCTGIVLRRKTRAFSADGSVQDTVDTAFAAEVEVVVQYLTGGRGHMWMWLSGLDATTTDEGTGLARRGSPVFIPSTSGNLAATNSTVGSGITFGANFAEDLETMTYPLIQIGTLLQDVTIVDSASAVQGKIAKVSI